MINKQQTLLIKIDDRKGREPQHIYTPNIVNEALQATPYKSPSFVIVIIFLRLKKMLPYFSPRSDLSCRYKVEEHYHHSGEHRLK